MTTRQMNTSAMTRYVDSVADTARNLEDLGRKIGYYAKDSDTLDSAIKRGKSGVTILFDESGGEPEVYTLGKQTHKVEVEKGEGPDSWEISYAPMAGAHYEKAVARGHEVARKAGPSKPMNLTKPIAGLGDAALLAKPRSELSGDDLRRREVLDAKKQREIRAESIARNEKIFAAQKAESERIWGNRIA